MSVINKKEFFLLWTKQTIKNWKEKFLVVFENALARELMWTNPAFINLNHFIQNYGDSKVNSQLLTNPQFMLNFLIIHNNKEFYPLDIMDFSGGCITPITPGEELSSANKSNSDVNLARGGSQFNRMNISNAVMGGANMNEDQRNQMTETFNHLL